MELSALGDGYQLVRPIGRGTTTMVLEAWDRQRRRRVALKVPIKPFAGDEAFLDRLQREVWAVAGFTHANVAAVHAIERDGQAAFVVVELVDGSSLRDMLADRGPLPPVRRPGSPPGHAPPRPPPTRTASCTAIWSRPTSCSRSTAG
jgi:serine/threonine protein kinase